MVIRKKMFGGTILISMVSLLTLTGCPGIGDRVLPREEAKVSMQGESICFWIPDVEDKQPRHIAINPIGTPFQLQKIVFSPDIKVVNEYLCIPPSFFRFPDEGQFIVEYVLAINAQDNTPRIVVTGIEMKNGRVQIIPLSAEEAE